jgi:phenylpropionate dioxygenase-like ring-hydroxylating dioxygenase large terminal subunit
MVHSSQTDGRIKHVVALVLLMALLACQVSTLSAFPATSSKAAFPSTNNGLIHPVVAFPSSEGNEGKATVASVNKEALVSKKFPRTWVPVASTYEIDPDRPSPVEFLGQNYVCYRDNDGQWVIMDDCCPHRLVPLSEGRINRDNNSLQCSYHGWEFNSQGSCIRIPQATPDVERAALSSAKSCVTSYPSHIEKNVLWFWPWKEDVLSVAGHRSKHPEGLMSSAQVNPSTYSRDLPYGWDSLVENLIDPSHVPFAHHGLQGKREDAIPINMTIPENLGEEGFRFEWQDRTSKLCSNAN